MDTVFQPLMDWIKDAIKDTLKKLLDIEENDDGYPELMDVSTTCDFLGIEYMTFTSKYRHLEGFPKELPAKRWSKRAIKNGLNNKFSFWTRLIKKENNMKLFNKLFKQQPKQPTQTVSLKESEERWQAMHDRNMTDLASQGVKKRDLYGWV